MVWMMKADAKLNVLVEADAQVTFDHAQYAKSENTAVAWQWTTSVRVARYHIAAPLILIKTGKYGSMA